jgi:hypothetical protein
MFFQEAAAVNTWQQLRMLRRLTNSLTVSMVECVLTKGKHRVAHSAITVFIYVIGKSRYGDKDLPP